MSRDHKMKNASIQSFDLQYGENSIPLSSSSSMTSLSSPSSAENLKRPLDVANSNSSCKLLHNLARKLLPSASSATLSMMAGRAVIRINTAPNTWFIDPMATMEKIKRRSSKKNSSCVYTFNSIQDCFIRYMKHTKSFPKGSAEMLELLYLLMGSRPPLSNSNDGPIIGQTRSYPAQEPMNVCNNKQNQDLDAALVATKSSKMQQSQDGSYCGKEPHNGFVVQANRMSDFCSDAVKNAKTKILASTSRNERIEEDALKHAFKIPDDHTLSRDNKHKAKVKSTKPQQIVRTISASSLLLSEEKKKSSEVPERLLIRDVLYALQGINSQYLYFDELRDRFEVNFTVTAPMCELICTVCELGWLYRKIAGHICRYKDDMTYGVVGQSFCHVLSTELSEFFLLLAMLAAQNSEDPQMDTNHGDISIRQLLIWTIDPINRFRLMARMIDSVEDLRGGALASGLHSYAVHGDPGIASFAICVVKRVTSSIYRMIRRWVFEGELEDIHAEFFVTANQDVPDDQLWIQKYELRRGMLPSFISLELAKEILLIGKSINFIRQCCGIREWVIDIGQDALQIASAIASDDGYSGWGTVESTEHQVIPSAKEINLDTLINKISWSTNRHLTQMMLDKFNLSEHCRALKSYLLLGQGDFIQHLMDLLGSVLSQRATNMYRHRLRGIFEAALNASNSKFESADVLARLDIQLLQGSPGETGWDILSIHYNLTPPVTTIINESVMLEYQRMFQFLWRLKRVEYSLSASWFKDMNLGHRVQDRVPSIVSLIHSCQLLRSEMIHFTRNLLSYIMFEVLETSWQKLVKDFKEAKNLDKLIRSHQIYISTIKRNVFMKEDSKDMLEQLKCIFDLIIRFCETQERLYTIAMQQLQDTKFTQQGSRTDTLETTNSDQHATLMNNQIFGPESKLGKQVAEIALGYRNHFQKLQKLIQARGTGFDFNEFYRNEPDKTEVAEQ